MAKLIIYKSALEQEVLLEKEALEPTLSKALYECKELHGQYAIAYVNKTLVPVDDWHLFELEENDIISVVVEIEFAVVGAVIGAIIGGAVATGAWYATAWGAIQGAFIGYSLGSVADSLLADQPTTPLIGIKDSDLGPPDYGWEGARLSFSPDGPVSVIYGQYQTGGTLISQYITSEARTSATDTFVELTENNTVISDSQTEKFSQGSWQPISDNILLTTNAESYSGSYSFQLTKPTQTAMGIYHPSITPTPGLDYEIRAKVKSLLTGVSADAGVTADWNLKFASAPILTFSGMDNSGNSGDKGLLRDNLAFWATNQLAGMTVSNITDGSSGAIWGNSQIDIYANLSGGTRNYWVDGDVYEIFTQADQKSYPETSVSCGSWQEVKWIVRGFSAGGLSTMTIYHNLQKHIYATYIDDVSVREISSIVQLKDSYLNILINHGEGEIEGIMNSDLNAIAISPNTIPAIRINGQPYENYYDIAWEDKKGTNTQSAISGFYNLTTYYPDKRKIVYDSPVTYTTTGTDLEEFGVLLISPSLFRINDVGEMKTNSFWYSLYYRVVGAESWTWAGNQRYSIACRSKTATYYLHTIKNLSAEQYEIKISRGTVEFTGLKRSGDFYLAGVNETKYEQIAYRNSALLALKIKATDQLSGSAPNITTILRGHTVTVPNLTIGGTTQIYENCYWDDIASTYKLISDDTVCTDTGEWATDEQWTTNPIWCTRDFILNKRYGLGEYYSSSQFDDTIARTEAKHCWELVSDLDGGTEHRFQMNISISQFMSAPVALKMLARTFRGWIIWSGGMLKPVIDRDRSPVQLFNASNIIPRSLKTTYLPASKIPNVVELQYADPDRNYNLHTVEVVDQDEWSDIKPLRKQTVSCKGITDIGQVLRDGKYFLNCAKYCTKLIEYKAEMDAIHCELGDEILFQSDSHSWGVGGRIVAATSSSITTNIDIVVGADTYYVRVRLPDGSLELKQVTNAAGTYRVITISGTFTTTPLVDSIFTFGKSAVDAKSFEVLNMKRLPTNECQIIAIEESVNKYNDTAGVYLPEPDYSDLPNPAEAPPAITDLVLTEMTNQPGFWISFNIPQESIAFHHADVHMSMDNISWFAYRTSVKTNTEIEVLNTKPGQAYYVKIISYNSVSVPNLASVFASITTTYSTFAPLDVKALRLDGEDTLNVFTKKDAKFKWLKGSVVSGAGREAAGQEPLGAGQYVEEIWYKYWIEVWVNSVKVRREILSDNFYVYTYEKNVSDNNTASNALTIKVWGYNEAASIKSNNPAILSVSNPATASPQNLTTTAFVFGMTFEWDQATEIDFSYWFYKYKACTHDADDGVWSNWTKTSDNHYSHKLTEAEMVAYGVNADVYITLVAYDTFGNVSSEVSTYAECVLISDPGVNVVITGTVRAHAGYLANWNIAEHTLTCDSGVVGLNSQVTTSTDWRFWAGHATPGNAPFRVDENGNLVATSATIQGTITAGQIHIPDQDATANSFHINTSGDMWLGCTETNFNAGNDNATAYILNTGIAKFQNITVTGGIIGGLTTDSVEGFYAGAAATRVQMKSAVGIWTGATAVGGAKNYLNVDGSGKIASGNFTWDTSGNVTMAGAFTSTATITGGIVQTAASGARSILNASGLQIYDATTQRAKIGSDGAGWLAASDKIAWTSAGVLTVGNWTVSSTELTGASAILKSGGVLSLGTGTDAYLQANRIYIDGPNNKMSVGTAFKVENGVVTASSGTIGTWILSANGLADNATENNAKIFLDKTNTLIRVGPTSGDYVTVDGNYGGVPAIVSSNYVSGMAGAGFLLKSDLLEVGNIAARGIIRTAVFQKDVISCIGGNLFVRPADVLATDMTAADASTLTIEGNESFAVNDILRIKDGTDDEWLLVTNIASAPTYTVTRDQASAYGADANPTWKKGASVVSYGASGKGGIYLTSSETNAPYLSMFTHAGSPWSAITTHLRIGNLNGSYGYGSELYGVGIGQYGTASKAWITIEQTNGIQIGDNTTTKIKLATDGSGWLAGDGKLNWDASGNIAMTGSITLTNQISSADISDVGANADQTSASPQACAWLTDEGALATLNTVNATYIDPGSITLVKCAAETTNQMFSDATKAINIQAWIKSGDVTKVDGGMIATNTLIADSIVVGNWLTLPSDENLVGYWTLDDGSGTVAVDGSGKNNHGTLVNMEEADWVDGRVGKCLSFDGVNEYVTIPDDSSLNFGTGDFSILFWANLTTYADSVATIAKVSGNYWTGVGYRFTSPAVPNTLYFRVVGTLGSIELNSGKGESYGWTQFVGTRNGNLFSLYVNGVLVTSTTIDVGNIDVATPLYIGRGSTGYYTGKEDEIRLYKGYALTASEIKALYLYPAGNKGTRISGNQITTGVIQSTNWAAAAGGAFDLDNEWIKMGGSNVTAAGAAAGIFLGKDTLYKAYIGDGANDYIKFDGTNVTMSCGIAGNALTIKNGANIKLEAGGDIILAGDNANTAKLIWDGTKDINFGVNTAGSNFGIWPETSGESCFRIGWKQTAAAGSLWPFNTIDLRADSEILLYMDSGNVDASLTLTTLRASLSAHFDGGLGEAAFKVYGAAVDNSYATISTAGTVRHTIDKNGLATLSGDLLVNGGDIGITADTNLIQLAANSLTVNGLATLSGDLLVNGGDIGITADTNLIQLAANSLTVNGAITLGTNELTCGSINRASGTLTLEIGGTPIINIANTVGVGAAAESVSQLLGMAPDAQSAIYQGVHGYTLSDATTNYGVKGTAYGGGGTNNYGVYGQAANAGTLNHSFHDAHGNYSDATAWHDVSDPAKKALIRNLVVGEAQAMYALLDQVAVKGYRYKSEIPILGYRKTKKIKNELGEMEPEPILDSPEKAPERFGFMANELPPFLSSPGKKGVAAGRIASFNTICLQHQKTLIEQLQEENVMQTSQILALETEVEMLKAA